MKLRCLKNSIRLRLRKSDIRTLKSILSISERLVFPGKTTLSYELQLYPNEHNVIFDSKKITIKINNAIADHWMDSEEVSIAFQIPTGDNETLSVLIEKDFPCKHTGEDYQDTFYELQPLEFSMSNNQP